MDDIQQDQLVITRRAAARARRSWGDPRHAGGELRLRIRVPLAGVRGRVRDLQRSPGESWRAASGRERMAARGQARPLGMSSMELAHRTPGSLRSPRVVNIADLRRRAKQRLPRVVFNYVDGGADDEITLRENCRVFEDVTLRPRQAVATQGYDLRTQVLGSEVALPALLAP